MKYRSISHVIGIFDLALTVIQIITLVTVSLAYIFGWITFHKDEFEKLNDDPEYSALDERLLHRILVAVAIVFIVGVCLLGCLQIYGAYKLIKGTEEGVSPSEGLSCCRTWRNIILVLYVLVLPYMIKEIAKGNLLDDCVPIVIFLGLRVIAILIVKQYMDELQLTLPSRIEMNMMPNNASHNIKSFPDTETNTQEKMYINNL